MNVYANYLVELVPQTFRKFNITFALVDKYIKVHALGIIHVLTQFQGNLSNSLE